MTSTTNPEGTTTMNLHPADGFVHHPSCSPADPCLSSSPHTCTCTSRSGHHYKAWSPTSYRNIATCDDCRWDINWEADNNR